MVRVLLLAMLLTVLAVGFGQDRGPQPEQAKLQPAPAALLAAAKQESDQYGGYLGLPLANNSGYFRTTQVGGRWWLVTPSGHAFFSLGVNSVNAIGGLGQPDGYATYFAAQYANLGDWQQLTTRRLLGWHFNTLGAWADPALAHRGLAETRILALSAGADIPRVNSSFPDVFDPAFAAATRLAAQSAISTAEVNDPWIIGYYSDNELWWYKDGVYYDQPNNSVVENFIAQAANKPGKLAWVASLEAHYPTVAALNAAWGSSYSDFRTGNNSLLAATSVTNLAASEDKLAFLRQIAGEYFRITNAAIKARDPNHLLLGCRFLPPPIFRPIIEGGAQYVDVFSVNMYNRTFSNPNLASVDTIGLWANKPVMITEFTARAADSGLPNGFRAPGQVGPTTDSRADSYRIFLHTLVSRPFVVGLHWFPYSDDATVSGNSNSWGLVTVHDLPYRELVSRMSEINRQLYTTAIGQFSGQTPIPTNPAYLGAIFGNSVQFRWQPVAGAGGYTLQAARTPDFVNARSYSLGNVNNYTAPDGFDYGRWYWRIRSNGEVLDSLAYTTAQPFYVYKVTGSTMLGSFESEAELANWQPEPAASFSLSRTATGATAGSSTGLFSYNGQVGAISGSYSWSYARKQPEGAAFQPRNWSGYDFYAFDATNPSSDLPDPNTETRLTGDDDAGSFYNYQTILRHGFNQVAIPLREAAARLNLAAIGHLRQGLLRPRAGQTLAFDNIRLLTADHSIPTQPAISPSAADGLLSGMVELDWAIYQPISSTVGYHIYANTANFSSAAGMTPVVTIDAAAQHTRVKLARLGGNTAPLLNGTLYYFAVAPVDAWGNEGPLGPTATATPSAPANLSDVAAGHWAWQYINFSFFQHLANGTPSGSGLAFNPNVLTRRDEVTKMLVRSLNLPLDNPGPQAFSDMAANHWAYRYVATAARLGLVNGYLDDTERQPCAAEGVASPCFLPGHSVGRAELTKMLVALKGWPPGTADLPFTDVQANHWAYGFVAAAFAHGLISGSSCGGDLCFRPNAASTRAEISKLVYQATVSD